MAKQSYKVQDFALKFDGDTYEAGDMIEMDAAEAEALVETGRLKKTGAPAKAKESKDKTQTGAKS